MFLHQPVVLLLYYAEANSPPDSVVGARVDVFVVSVEVRVAQANAVEAAVSAARAVEAFWHRTFA